MYRDSDFSPFLATLVSSVFWVVDILANMKENVMIFINLFVVMW